MTTVAVLTAAGGGTRLGGDVAKALVELAGRPLVAHAAAALVAGAQLAGEPLARLVVTAPQALVPVVADAVAGAVAGLAAELAAEPGGGAVAGSGTRAPVADVPVAEVPVADVPVVVVPGGATRQASVAAGLAALADVPGEAIVLVHDAARPLLPPRVVARVIAAAAEHDAVIPVVPVVDTVKRVVAVGGAGSAPVTAGGAGERVIATVDRRDLRAVQTPQGFRLATLRRAHAAGAGVAADESAAATDDAGLVEAMGEAVHVVQGDPDGLKVTTPRDLVLAAALLAAREVAR